MMKLRTKLILLAAVPLTGLALAVATFYGRTQRLEQAVHQVTTESVVFAELAQRLQLHVVQVQQYLSDVSATRALDGLDDGFQRAAAERGEFLAGLARFREMFAREQDSRQGQQVASVEQAFERYYQRGLTMATAYVQEGPAGGNKLMAEFDAAATVLTNELDTFVRTQINELTVTLTRVETSSHRTAFWLAVLGLLLATGTLVFAARLIQSIVTSLRHIAGQVTDNASSVRASASELSQASQVVAEGASEQAASLEETSASLEEISSMTRRNAAHAANGVQLGAAAKNAAGTGLQRVNDLGQTLNSIKVAVTDMQTTVAETQASSREISKIIKTIDEIAFQTNLLALNAAVEAARAGESGAGFAVVADEVRALAQRSAQAARDTADKISAAVQRSEHGSVASANVVRSLTEVESTAQSLHQVFQGIVTHTRSLDDVVAGIAAASQEQSQGINEVNTAVSQMDKVTQSNAAAAEENAASATTLNAQSSRLQETVNRLQLLIDGRISAPGPADNGGAHRPSVSTFQPRTSGAAHPGNPAPPGALPAEVPVHAFDDF